MVDNLWYVKNTAGGQHHVDAPSILGKWHVSNPFSPRLISIYFPWLPLLLSGSGKVHQEEMTEVAGLISRDVLEFLP